MQIWKSDPLLKKNGSLMYEMILLHMDKEHKREAVGYLVEHINSLSVECRPEVDCALDVMGRVSLKCPTILEPYTDYIRETLYHMDLMTFSQVMRFFS